MIGAESTAPAAAGTAPANDDYPCSRAYAWYMLALLMLLMVFGLMDRMIIGTLFPQLKLEWNLSDTQLGVIVSAVSWSMAGCVIPAAILVDRWSRTKAIGLMASVWTLATVACGMAGNFLHLFFARLFIGAGEGGYNAGAVSLISGIFPERLRSTAISMFSAAGAVGSVIGVALGGYVASHYGWRQAFFVVAAPGFVVALLFMLTARDFRTVALEVKDQGGVRRRMGFREVLRELFATRSLVCLYLGIACLLFLQTSIVAWAPSLFTRGDGLPMDQASLRSALILLVAATGTVLGGIAVDRWKKRSTRASLLGPAIYCVIGGLALAFGLASLHGSERFAMMLFGALFMSASFGPIFAACQTVVHAGLRATTIGVINVIGHGIGGMGPIVTGMLSDSLGLPLALAISSLSLLGAGAFFYVGSRSYAADVARVPLVRITMA